MLLFIGDNIKRLRRERGITQEQLAEVLNLSCAAVSKWERGETLPDITLLQPLAYYFGVTVDSLLGYDGERVKRQIDEMFEQYRKLYRSDWRAARELIIKAYHEFPGDFRVMDAYMWDIIGDYADNDPEVILAHKDELESICSRILDSCTDERLRFRSISMRAKILHAEGRTDEAIALLRERMNNWYETCDQKIEQLFAKDTPEFLRQVKINEYELVSFAADKFHKGIFFDRSIAYGERISRIERVGDEISRLRRETGEFFFAAIETHLFGRLLNDLIAREGKDEDIVRIAGKVFALGDELEEMAKNEGIYDSGEEVRYNKRRQYLGWIKNSKVSERVDHVRELLTRAGMLD